MPLFQAIKRSERTAAVSRDPNHFFPHADTLIPSAIKGRHTSTGLRRNSPFSIMIDTFTLGLTNSLFLADLTIRFGLSLRVIMRKRAPSVSFAWLVLILLIPFAGALIYLLFGENRLGERRANRLIKDRPIIREWSSALRNKAEVDWSTINPECLPLDRQIVATTGIPTMPGNQLELIDTADRFFSLLIDDIRRAQSSCYLEFYILSEGGRIDELLETLLAARKRGVVCRVLLDSIGSKLFLRGGGCLAIAQGEYRGG